MYDPATHAAILAAPDHGAGWLALAAWLRDNDRNEEAAAVRAFWPAMRNCLAAGRSLEAVLADVRRSAWTLGRCARWIEERLDGRA
jgi:hypothetical protein